MKLQELRKRAMLSQAGLSKQSGVNLRTIQEYENGRRKIEGAHIDALIRIADTLAVPFYELLDDDVLKNKIQENIKREV